MQNNRMNKNLSIAIDLCNNGRYKEALPFFDNAIEQDKQNDDVYRMKAQTLMMLERFSEAIDVVIDALNINPENVWTLILMGNIWAKQGNVGSAMHYYNEALKFHPNDVIAINNIGAAYAQQNMFEKALEVFDRALDVDSSYINTYYGKALVLNNLNRYEEAWKIVVKAGTSAMPRKENPQVVEEMNKLKMSIANKLVERGNAYRVIGKVIDELQELGGVEIKIEETDKTYLSAKLEYAKTHNRNYHRIIYNKSKNYHEHLILHELTHLRMMIDASKNKKNQIPTTTDVQETAFHQRYVYFLNKIAMKIGLDEAKTMEKDMIKGLALQLFNCPLDLLVEDYIYKNYPEIRPMQFLSLFSQEDENIKSVQSATSANIFPPQVVKANKLMNIVTSIHLEELYGLNFLDYYKPTKNDLNTANDLYEEYKAYRDDYTSGEEYDLCRYFIETLGFEDLITWIDEDMIGVDSAKEFRSKEEIQNVDSEKIDSENEEFSKNHPDGEDLNETMMMTMYMLDAMQRFDKIQHSDVRKIAFEIATIGITGIDPNKKTGYQIPYFGNEDFGGYRLLAYYYVSFARELPDLLPKLSLPFSKAYESALAIHSKNGK